jgi:hypothetical protein
MEIASSILILAKVYWCQQVRESKEPNGVKSCALRSSSQTCLLLQDTGTKGTGYQRVLLGSKVIQGLPSKFLAQLD